MSPKVLKVISSNCFSNRPIFQNIDRGIIGDSLIRWSWDAPQRSLAPPFSPLPQSSAGADLQIRPFEQSSADADLQIRPLQTSADGADLHIRPFEHVSAGAELQIRPTTMGKQKATELATEPLDGNDCAPFICPPKPQLTSEFEVGHFQAGCSQGYHSNMRDSSRKQARGHGLGQTGKKVRGDGPGTARGGSLRLARFTREACSPKPHSSKTRMHNSIPRAKTHRAQKLRNIDEEELRDVCIDASEEMHEVERRLESLGSEDLSHLQGCGGWPYTATRKS